MTFLFLIITVAIALAYFGCKKTALGFLIASFVLNYWMLWYHMTDTLRINW